MKKTETFSLKLPIKRLYLDAQTAVSPKIDIAPSY